MRTSAAHDFQSSLRRRPAQIPQPIVDRPAKEISSIAKEPDIVAKLAAAGVEAVSTTPAQFSDIIQNEQGAYAEVVQAAARMRQ